MCINSWILWIFSQKKKVKKYHKMLLIRPFKHDGKSKNIQRRAGFKTKCFTKFAGLFSWCLKNFARFFAVIFDEIWCFLWCLLKFVGFFLAVFDKIWIFIFCNSLTKITFFLHFEKIHVFPYISFMILWWNRQFFNGWKIMGWDSLMEFIFLQQVFKTKLLFF